MNLNLKKIGFIITVFVYIFAPPILPIGTGIIGGMFFILYFLMNYRRIQKNLSMKSILIVFGWILALFLYAVFSYVKVYNGFSNIISAYMSNIYIFIFTLFGAVAICDMCVRNNYSDRDIWRYIIYAGVMQGVLSIMSYVFDPVQTILCKMLENIMAADIIAWWRNYRLYGLSCSLTYAMPIAQSLIGGMALIYAKKYDKKFYVFVPLLWLSALINARVTMIVVILELMILLTSKMKYIPIFKVKKNDLLIYVIGGCVVFLVIIGIWISGMDLSRIVDPIIEIFSLLKGEKIYTTNGYLAYFFVDSKAFAIPKRKDFLFGGGIWNCVSDIGYIYDLWIGGIVYSLALYLSYFCFIKIWCKTLKSYQPSHCIVPAIFGVVLLVVNIKGNVFGGMNEVLNLFYLMIGISIFIKKHENEREKYDIK